MTNFPTVFQGFIIMVVMNVIGLTLVFSGGMILDEFYYRFNDLGYYSSAAAVEWGTDTTVIEYTNMYYGVCVLICILGIVAFVATVLRRQQYDEYVQPAQY